MKKIFVLLLLISSTVFAKERLYLVNAASKTGTYNAIMSAYAEDLSTYYNIEYIQGNGCIRAESMIKNIKEPTFVIWQGLDTVDYILGETTACNVMPTKENFIRADIKYPVLSTAKDTVTRERLFTQESLTVGVHKNSLERWFVGFARYHGLNYKIIRYKNSDEIALAIVNKEIDIGLTNTKSYSKHQGRIQGLFSFNPAGELGLPSIRAATKFNSESNDTTVFFVNNMSVEQKKSLTAIIRKLHLNPNSNISQWYQKADGYISTLDLPDDQALAKTRQLLTNWAK